MIYTEMGVVPQTCDWNLIYDYDCKKKISKYLKYGKANLLSTFVFKYDDKKENQVTYNYGLIKVLH